MGMKNRREALIEFLRLKIGRDSRKTLLQDPAEEQDVKALEREYLNIFVNKTEREPSEAYKSLSMKDIQEPYN